MQNVDALAVLFCQRHKPLGRDQGCFGVAPLGVRGRIAGAAQAHAGFEPRFILGVKRRTAREFGDDAIERGFVVNEQIAGR